MVKYASVMKAISLGIQYTGIHKMANSDIILMIINLQTSFEIEMIKVKSHRELAAATDDYDFWTILGNTAADKAATVAINRLPNTIASWISDLVKQEESNKNQLKADFDMANLNKVRLKLLQDDNKVPKPANHEDSFFKESAAALCKAYSVPNAKVLDNLIFTNEAAEGCLQGTIFAHILHWWWQQLRWPDESDILSMDPETRQCCDWGVSWFELVVNLVIATGCWCPVGIGGAGGQFHLFNLC